MFKNNIDRTLIVFVAIFLWTRPGFAQNPPSETPEGTFKAKCAMCHGADVRGNTPMGKKLNIQELRAPEVQNRTDVELIDTVTKGMEKMPPFGGKLSKEEIESLVAYIREIAGKH